MDSQLIIFVRNPVAGRVKTRLAGQVGKQKALEIYQQLLAHTLSITRDLACDKVVYYSDFLPGGDNWTLHGFGQALQSGNDLGARMQNALLNGFNAGYRQVMIIGSDCFELTSEIIRTAMEKLRTHDVVIGPAKDGGYYLLGLHALIPGLFENKSWSTSSVLADTLADVRQVGCSFVLLEQLSDVDEEKDLSPLQA